MGKCSAVGLLVVASACGGGGESARPSSSSLPIPDKGAPWPLRPGHAAQQPMTASRTCSVCSTRTGFFRTPIVGWVPAE